MSKLGPYVYHVILPTFIIIIKGKVLLATLLLRFETYHL